MLVIPQTSTSGDSQPHALSPRPHTSPPAMESSPNLQLQLRLQPQDDVAQNIASPDSEVPASDSGFSSAHSEHAANEVITLSDDDDEAAPMTSKKRRWSSADEAEKVCEGRRHAKRSKPNPISKVEPIDLEPLLDDVDDEVEFGEDGSARVVPHDEVLSRLQEDEEIIPADRIPRAWRAPRQEIVGVKIHGSTFPKSTYEGYIPPLPVEKERSVLRTFLDREESTPIPHLSTNTNTNDNDEEGFITYKLDELTIYRPKTLAYHADEMALLSDLNVRTNQNKLVFNGILSDGHSRHYVQGITFDLLSIGNYMDSSTHDIDRKVWIQTPAGQGMCGAWYELGTPATEYVRYWKPFIWLATFTKYFIDFIDMHRNDGHSITLNDFKSKFSKEIQSLHGHTSSFRRWWEEYNNDDFRQVVSVNASFLFNEMYNTSAKLTKLPITTIFDEVLHQTAIKEIPGEWISKTVVSPFVHGCFQHMFGNALKVVKPLPQEADPAKVQRLQCVKIPKRTRIHRDERGNICEPQPMPEFIQRGDVIVILRDEETVWQGDNPYWYAYVTEVRQRKSEQVYDIVWLYSPEDTICGGMRYPYTNELFFSDHCEHGTQSIPHTDVLCKASVEFLVGPEDLEKSGKEFFVRNRYLEKDCAFVTLTATDLAFCPCQINHDYVPKVGDVVLVDSVRVRKGRIVDVLEPVLIHALTSESMIEVRELAKFNADYSTRHRKAMPNELVWTSNIFEMDPDYIARKCHVRFVLEADVHAGKLPHLYDQEGALDMFYISCFEGDNRELRPFKRKEDFPTQSMSEAISLELPVQVPLRGLDLFCGGGNFGRGLEEGGAVRNVCAVDIFSAALHTYRANLPDLDETLLYHGSVNNFLKDAIRSCTKDNIPLPGQIDFISAGSPCQGFSRANQSQDSNRSLQNCSLIASVASFIDVYRPQYALIENVEGLATTRKKRNGELYNVFSQLLCSLVGMGYQVQQFLVDAWSCGSAQSRTRLMVSITAPGLTPQSCPAPSHEHPPFKMSRCIIKAPNGVETGSRQLNLPCPFKMRTSYDVMSDLPNLHDNHVNMCIPYPDHRCTRSNQTLQRQFLTFIPPCFDAAGKVWGFYQTRAAGLLPSSLASVYKTGKYKESKTAASWARIPRDGLCRTVITAITAQCSFTGRWVHYDQPRLLTVMEVRRVQSFPDTEVLVGNVGEAFKIVGNSVDRRVARALGVGLREAVEENERRGKGREEMVV